jgi:hypothetical protein
MSRSQNLRQNVINQMLEGIAKRHIRSPLPPHQPHHGAPHLAASA